MEWIARNSPAGVAAHGNQIAATCDDRAQDISLIDEGFENEKEVVRQWQARGTLPSLDGSIAHTGKASALFDPSALGPEPRSPYADRAVTQDYLEHGQDYELSFWARTAGPGDFIRFWVGRANGDQYPHYMYYTNWAFPAGQDWVHCRTSVRPEGPSPLMLRFWCPPTEGRVWLDDVVLRPTQERTIVVPLRPPADAGQWGCVHWKLSPADARCDATIIDPKDRRRLRTRLYSGDSLAPLVAIVGLKPVWLRLSVYPTAAEPVAIEEIKVTFGIRAGS
jgi:hypothetical protein